MDKEDAAEAEQFKAFLGQERTLKTLFDYLRAGTRKPQAIAKKLKTEVRTIKSLRKRLKRKWVEFFQTQRNRENQPAPRKRARAFH